MPAKSSFANVILDVNPGTNPSAEVTDPESPFRILLLGDFSGRRAQIGAAVHALEAHIDRSRQFRSGARAMGVGLPKLSLTFRDLDDFHPDRIYQKNELFRALRDQAKNRQANRGLAQAKLPRRLISRRLPAYLLDSILEVSDTGSARPVTRRDDLQSFVESVTAP